MPPPQTEPPALWNRQPVKDYRLKLTVDEARQLFSQIHQEVRDICQEACQSSPSPSDIGVRPTDSRDQLEELWPLVDEEIRRTFEMCRCGLDVEGVDVKDVEEFRGFCEDFDGVEPIDQALFASLAEKVTEINRLMEVRAMNRTKLPKNVKTMFRQHVAHQRQQFDAMLDHSAPVVDGTPYESAITDIAAVPPTELAAMAAELSAKLEELNRLAEIAAPAPPDQAASCLHKI